MRATGVPMPAAFPVSPTRPRRIRLAQVLGILALVAAAAACSSDPPPEPAASNTGDASSTAGAGEEASKRQTADEETATADDAGTRPSGIDQDTTPRGSTAGADEEASNRPTATEDEAAPGGAGARRFDIDQDTTLREVFDTLSGAEKACVRGALAGDVLASMLDTPVLPDDPDGTGPSILSCLAPDTAREFFLSATTATMVAAAAEEGLSARVGKDEQACMRDLLAGVDVAALASEPESDEAEEFDVSGLIGLSDLSLGLFSCVPDVLAASLGGLTPEQESCVRDLASDVAAGDYRSVLASDPELDDLLESEPDLVSLGPLLGLSFDVLSCLPDETDDAAPDDPAPVPDETDDDPNADPPPDPGKSDAVDDDHGNDNIDNDNNGNDDHADVPERATPLDVGEVAPGVMDHEYDIDFFVFRAEPDRLYRIKVARGTLPDSATTLYDPDGVQITFNAHIGDTAAGPIYWQGDYTGDHYVAVRGHVGSTGTYTLTVTAFDEGVFDDHADVPHWATPVEVGEAVGVVEAVPGAIDHEGDIDFFVFWAEEDSLYRIDVALGTLPSDSIVTLYGDNGWMIASNDDDPAASRIHWETNYTGDYYIAVQDNFGGTGTYTLTVTADDGYDDYADVLDMAASVGIGEAVLGVMDHEGDVDFFVFRAEQGTRYEIDVALGTLQDSDATLYDSDGFELAFNEDFDGTGASRIHWQADYTGDHYVAVRDYGGGAGTYTLTVTPVVFLDDHADVSHWATPAGVGKAVLGVMDHEGDIDFFVFQAEYGMRYQIDVALGTLPDSVLEFHDAYGSKLASNDDYGGTAASRIHRQAAYTGDHYVAVQSPTGSTGTYTLSIASTDGHTFNAVTAGSSHTCGLRTDNTITCWGNNYYAQADPPPGEFSSVTAGSSHTCGLRTDNTITCWGQNHLGQTDAPSGEFSSVTAGLDHTCGLRTDNTITCWGDNDLGRADPPPGAFRSVAAGGHHTCGLRTDNTITCWGRNHNGQTDPPPGAFTAIALGGHHTCGLRTDNTITCWGWNDYGQTDPPPGAFTAIALGGYHTCGLRTDDTITCWGGYFSQADLPGSFKAVAAGWEQTCGLRTDDTVTCWS